MHYDAGKKSDTHGVRELLERLPVLEAQRLWRAKRTGQGEREEVA